MNDQLIVGPHGEEIQPRASDLLEIIARAVSNPAVDVDKMSKLFDLHERIAKQQREASFMAALARLQAKLPMVEKDGRMVSKGVEQWRFAKRETIHAVIQPLLASEGFSLVFNEEIDMGRALRVFSGTLSHADGHSVTKYKTLSLDSTGSKNSTQAEGSTTSYAQRYLTKMLLNIVEKDQDDDGQGGAETISKDDALNLQALLEEMKVEDVEENKRRFLEDFMGVKRFEDILARDYKKAITAINERKRGAR